MANTDEPNDKTVILSDEKTPPTAPVMKQILEGIYALTAEAIALREEQKGIREDIRDMKKTVHSLERRLNIFNQHRLRIRADILDYENRVEEWECKVS